MAMTLRDRKGKRYLHRLLRNEGYPTYAKIFDLFDFHMIDSPYHIAWLDPVRGTINVNNELDKDQCSVVVRHEILHAYLQHYDRMISHIAKSWGLDPDVLDEISLGKITDYIFNRDPSERNDNIAADYEISNRGYTKKDKESIRRIKLGGQVLSGLITEDDHPDWLDLSMEEMFDLLEKDRESRKNKVLDGVLLNETTFIDPLTGITYGV